MRRSSLGVLLLASVASADLAPFEKLVGGQWITSAKLPDGRDVRSRTVWTWGINRKLVRMQGFNLGPEGEVQQYETIVFHHPTNKRLEYRVFSRGGLLAKGVATALENGVRLEQEATPTFPAMRTDYALTDKDACTARISFKGEEGWKQRITSKLSRKKRERYKTLDLQSGGIPVQALSHFTGTWLQGEDKSTGAWSLHKCLLHVVDEGKAERFVSFDLRAQKLLLFVVTGTGAYFEGEVKRAEKDWIWEFTVHPGKRQTRLICTPAGKEKQIWRSEVRTPEGKWTASGKPWESRRPAKEK